MPGPLENASVSPAPAAPAVPSPFADVLAGQIPAVSLAPITGQKTDPAQEFVVTHLDELSEAGLDYHETPDNHSVMFNPKKISAKEIDEADKAGKLFEIAPLVTDLKLPGMAAPAEASEATPAAAGGVLSGASVPTDGKLKTARLRNVAPAPTTAPNPVPGVLGKRAI